MKRFHVHVSVADLAQNVRFYSRVFGHPPTVLKDDYAKWMLDDPRVNFAVSTRSPRHGVDHLGIQAENEAELDDLRINLIEAQAPMLAQKEASCCYAKSDKYWTTDPQGIPWETFHSLGEIPLFGDDTATSAQSGSGETPACCAPGATGKFRGIEVKAHG